MAKERGVTFAVDPTPEGIVALAENNLSAKSVVLAIDSAIEYANNLYDSKLQQAETETQQRDLQAAEAGRSRDELDKIADELEKPDPRQQNQ
jgi:hypothetical protein